MSLYEGSRVAVFCVDPSRKRSGGALLGDRIRMNAIDPERVFLRSFATRGVHGELAEAINGAIGVVVLPFVVRRLVFPFELESD